MASVSPVILVVEPHAELRQTLKEGLTGNFEVIVAQTARGALVGFEHHQPAVVLMSMNQDSMHGFELSGRIRDLDELGRCLRVVYGTPSAEQPDDLLEGDFTERYGVHEYIPRGATLRRLETLISEHLRRPIRIPAQSSRPAPTPEQADESDGDQPVDPRWNNPFTSTDVVSAKRPASGSLSKSASSKLGWLFRR